MRVQFVESGGLPGAVKGCDLNTATLPAAAASLLVQLVEASGLSASGAFRSDVARDLREYEITIDKGEQQLCVTFDELSLPQAAKSLVAYLRQHARPMPP